MEKVFLVIIPARGGSKGVKNKNIFPINNVPLIAYTIEFLRQLPWLKHKVVSTDSIEIMKISSNLGIIETKLRPEHLGGDDVGDLPVLRHELLQYENSTGVLIDFVIMLQPTSPIRFEKFISDAVRQLVDSGAQSLLSIKLIDLKYHPYKQFIIKDDVLNLFDSKGLNVIQRQQLQNTYIRDGVFYGFSRSFIFDKNSIIGEKSSYILNPYPSINIDTIEDLKNFTLYVSSNPLF
jgi:CMP-N,N'-diacetyllegionaminic acid synthase